MSKDTGFIVCDTSVLISERVGDTHQARALALIESISCPILVSRLNQLEFTTVVCRLEGERKLNAVSAKGILQMFDEHVKAGLLETVEMDESRIWKSAVRLARQYSGTILVRSLDVWQVAFAVEMGAAEFWSFDNRQRELATAVGLKINP